MTVNIDEDFTEIKEILNKVPLSALSLQPRAKLAAKLDEPKLFFSDNEYNLPRYWVGLADLVGVELTELDKRQSPALRLIEKWSQMRCDNGDLYSLGDLVDNLVKIDRLDVFEDFKSRFGK